MICSNCGKTINDDSLFCAYCGAKTQQLCGSCGAALMPGAAFCSRCGAAVGGQAQAAPSPKPKPAPKPASAPKPAPKAAMQTPPRSEPFFRKWIEENKEWAEANDITWISEFVGSYALSVDNSGVVTIIKEGTEFGKQVFEKISVAQGGLYANNVSWQLNPKASNNKTPSDAFYNGLKYFAFNFYTPKKDKEYDTDFLSAFGGLPEGGAENIKEYMFTSGIMRYDGSFIKIQNAHNFQDTNIGFWARHAVLNEKYYIEVDNPNVIPEKNFNATKIVRLDNGEVVLSNVHVDGEFFDNDRKSTIIFIPYDDRINNYYRLYHGKIRDEGSAFHKGYAGCFLCDTSGKALFGKTGGLYPRRFEDYFWNMNKVDSWSRGRADKPKPGSDNRGGDFFVYYDNVRKKSEEMLSGYPVVLDTNGNFVLKIDSQKVYTNSDKCWVCDVYAGCVGNEEFYFVSFPCYEDGNVPEKVDWSDPGKTFLYTRPIGSNSPATLTREFEGRFFAENRCEFIDGEDSSNYKKGFFCFRYSGKDYLAFYLNYVYDPKNETTYDKFLVLTADSLETVAEFTDQPDLRLFVAGGKLYVHYQEKDQLTEWYVIRCLNDKKKVVKVNEAISVSDGFRFNDTYLFFLSSGCRHYYGNVSNDAGIVSLKGKVILQTGELENFAKQESLELKGHDWFFSRRENDPLVSSDSFVVGHGAECGYTQITAYFIINVKGNITGPYIETNERNPEQPGEYRYFLKPYDDYKR